MCSGIDHIFIFMDFDVSSLSGAEKKAGTRKYQHLWWMRVTRQLIAETKMIKQTQQQLKVQREHKQRQKLFTVRYASSGYIPKKV